MSESKFLSALIFFQKPQDPNTLLGNLITIRKEVDWPKNKDNITKVRERGCLKPIVNTLKSNQRHILDTSLSILGNCCMDRTCSRDVVAQFNILFHLHQLLKRFPKQDSLNGRVYRIIGNLCQHKDQWANTIMDRKPELIKHLIHFVKKLSSDEPPENIKASEATVMMAIRALRYLVNCYTILNLVKNFEVLKVVGSLFIKYSLEWKENKKYENVLNNILRLIEEYSKFKYYNSILEMRNTERGDSLLHLSNVLLLAPVSVVKIVMNFTKICELKSDLPVPEICDKLMEIFNNRSAKDFDGECIECLQCLCYLLEHPANLNTQRCGKCIPLFVKILDDFSEPTTDAHLECCIFVIIALNKYKYDEKLLVDQIKSNSIEALLKKLQWIVGSSLNFVINHNSKKRKYPFKGTSTGGIDDVLRDYKRMFGFGQHTRDIFRCERSTSPSTSSELGYSMSNSSSPRSLNAGFSDSDSDDYSPVCSDSEEDCDMPMVDMEENSQDGDRHTKKNFEGILAHKTSNLKTKLLVEIVKLLLTYVKIKPVIPQLASEELLIALIKSSLCFNWPMYTTHEPLSLISKILDSHDYLIPLMQTDFIVKIHDLAEHTYCTWCIDCTKYSHCAKIMLEKLTTLAESGIGRGEIAHKMLRGDNKDKQKLVLIFPLLIRSQATLAKLMLNCGGLETLMKLLKEDSNLKQRSIKVICNMAATKLFIVNPVDNKSQKIIIDPNLYILPEIMKNKVILKLNNDSLVEADRDFLCSHSDFFNSLLNGYFKESTEDIVSLHSVESRSFVYLLKFLYYLPSNQIQLFDIDIDLETLLDVILLSDRFLMPDLCLALTNAVQIRITPETVFQIYHWSLESKTNLLRIECVAFALVASISEAERIKMFENLFGLGYSEPLLEDIKALLIRHLSINSGHYLSKKTHLKVHLRRMKDNLLKDFSR